jgi:thiol-disulfide isomerase/thioredoxin
MKKIVIALLLMSANTAICNGVDSTGKLVLTGTNVLGEIYPIEVRSYHGNRGTFVVNSTYAEPGYYHFIDGVSQSNGAFFLLKGDSAIISRDKKDNSLTITWSDKALKAVFDAFEKRKIGQYYAWDAIDFLTPNKFESTYLKSCDKYSIRKGIIDSLSNTLTKDKVGWLYKLAKINRLYSLLIPYNPCSPGPERLSETSEIKYQKEVSELILTVNSLTNTDISTFSYCLSDILVNYSRYITRNSRNNVFEHRYKSSMIFEPEIKDMYLTLIMLDKVNNKDINTGFLNQYIKDCKNDSYKEKVIASLSFVDKVSNDSLMLTTPLEGTNGSVNAWKDVLSGHRGSVVYVDLWASWCVGCKLNIPKVIAMKSKYPALKIVFISKDKGNKEWARSIQSWGISTLGEHLRLDPETELAKIISEPSIPRGLLINKAGVIVTIDADEPNSDKLNELINNLL